MQNREKLLEDLREKIEGLNLEQVQYLIKVIDENRLDQAIEELQNK